MDATLLEGAQERILQLDWRPAGVEIAATDAQGQPVDARIQLVGPVDHPAIDLGEDGVGLVELRPGEWQVISSTDTLGPSRSEIKMTG